MFTSPTAAPAATLYSEAKAAYSSNQLISENYFGGIPNYYPPNKVEKSVPAYDPVLEYKSVEPSPYEVVDSIKRDRITTMNTRL